MPDGAADADALDSGLLIVDHRRLRCRLRDYVRRMSTSAPDEHRPSQDFDAHAVLADIERDVRERRRSGEITAEFELELANAFSEVAPNGSVGGGFDEVVGQAARHAVVDYDAPITGNKPLRLVKRAVKVLTAWYLIFVGRQLVAFAGTTLRALRLLGSRVDALEQCSPATDPRLRGAVAPVSDDLDLSGWSHLIVRTLVDATERTRDVVHGDCGDGALIVELVDAGVDCYGVDSRSDAGAQADERGLSVRGDDTLLHLRSVAAQSLSGVVLSGCVDRYALGEQVELLNAAHRALTLGGVLVLVGRDPRGVVSSPTNACALLTDLAPGRPLHSTTWSYLLEKRGFESIQADAAEPNIDAHFREHADPAVRMLAELVVSPESFCIRARRG